MAKFYKDLTGEHGLRLDDDDERNNPIPAGSDVVEFDAETNQPLMDSLSGRSSYQWQDHEVVSGEIHRDGTAVTVVADLPHAGKRKQARQLIGALESGTANNRQAQRAIAFLLREYFKDRA